MTPASSRSTDPAASPTAAGDRRGPGGPLVLVGRPADVLALLDRRLLSEQERRRGRALARPADREAHAAAHLLARRCAAVLTGRDVEEVVLVQRCPECGSEEHGRPSIAGLPGLHVSLAHAPGAVAAVAGLSPVGIDVEARAGRDVRPALLAAALSPAERDRQRTAIDRRLQFLRSWVRKEALVKMGTIRLEQMSEVDLESSDQSCDGRTVTRFGSLVLVDWLDPDLDVVVGVAASSFPVVAALPVGGDVR